MSDGSLRKPSKATAYHEAGHAIAPARIGFVFDRVVLGYDNERQSLGGVWRTEWPGFPPWPNWMHAVVLMAGPFAEAKHRRQSIGKIWLAPSSESDARSLEQLDLTDNELLDRARDTWQVLKEQWPAITRTAMDLLAVGELSFDDIEDRVIWPAARNAWRATT